MLSRVASSTYWLVRYIERAENMARFTKVELRDRIGSVATSDVACRNPNSGIWDALISMGGSQDELRKRFAEKKGVNRFLGGLDVFHFVALDHANPNSIRSCIELARCNAREIRHRVPVEICRQLSILSQEIGTASTAAEVEPETVCEQIERTSLTITGICASMMSHQDRHFAQLGRMLERAYQTATILELSCEKSGESRVLSPKVLMSTAAIETYRREFGEITLRGMTEFLIGHHNSPRSIRYCLTRALAAIRSIENMLEVDQRRASLKPHAAYQTQMQLLSMCDELDSSQDQIATNGLRHYADQLQGRLNEIGATVQEDFFTLAADTDSSSSTKIRRPIILTRPDIAASLEIR